MTCVLCIDDDTIFCLFICVDVGPRGHEVELMRASIGQELGRLSRGGPRGGERRRCKDIEVRPAGDERAARRHNFYDPSAGPSHAPPTAAGAEEDLVRRFETVF